MSIDMERRLNGIEDKLDRIDKSLIQMVRTEERVTKLLEQNVVLFKKLEKTESVIDDLKKDVQKLKTENALQSRSLGFFERLGWLILTVIGGIIGWMFRV